MCVCVCVCVCVRVVGGFGDVGGSGGEVGGVFRNSLQVRVLAYRNVVYGFV